MSKSISVRSSEFEKIYASQLKKLDDKFAKIFKNCRPKSLYEPCDYVIQAGGKRIRPILVLFSAKLCGAKFSDVYNAAIAAELMHTFTLVHDDIMDNADKRRGRPTLHITHDINTAILAGDHLVGIAYNYLLKDAENTSVVSDFTQCLIEVCEGQSLDKDFEIKQDVTIDEYKTMIYKKTAAMVVMCCSVGARIAKANDKQIKALKTYAKNLGMAFQIQDDLLDIIADEKKFGKKIGGDLREGKKTYLFLKALEKARGDEKQKLVDLIAGKGAKEEEIEYYKELYIKLGVIEDAKKEIFNYTAKALNSLKIFGKKKEKEALIWLANSLLKRNR